MFEDFPEPIEHILDQAKLFSGCRRNGPCKERYSSVLSCQLLRGTRLREVSEFSMSTPTFDAII